MEGPAPPRADRMLGPARAAQRWAVRHYREARRLAAFLAQVEPALAARPRVHRFAEVPRLGAPGAPAEPLPLLVEGDDRAARERTFASFAGQKVSRVEVVQEPGRAEWVAIAGAGDVLAPLALERLGQAARLAPEAHLVTCDEDELDRAGRRRRPALRPGPSPDLLRARDLTSSLVAVRVADLPPDRAPGWRHRLALSLAPDALAHVPLILAHRTAAAPPAPPAPVAGPAVAGEPSVAVVVLFRDRPELLARCARAVLRDSAYERLELVLVDNGSTDPAIGPLLDSLAGDSRVRVLSDARPFNFAALNNAAVRSTDAEVVVLLNNDTAVLTPTWIEGLLAHAQRPEVGAVAPLLLYPDGRVQHAGAALGLHGYAGHPFAGLTPDARTPFGSARDGVRNWLAVTAACLMVERRKWDAVGGFDEEFVVAGNDVDLGLRLTAAGFRSLCVPSVELLHDESRSRGGHIDRGDFARSARSYGGFRTVGDPFYNPNLTLTRTDCGLRAPGEALPS